MVDNQNSRFQPRPHLIESGYRKSDIARRILFAPDKTSREGVKHNQGDTVFHSSFDRGDESRNLLPGGLGVCSSGCIFSLSNLR
jgi:hypothetical protein